MSKPFSGEIRVASRIVDYLSSGLYNSPAACLKELINNSYDADAREVTVSVKPDANRIIVADDGTGMTRDEFERHFKSISESHKREHSDVTPSGRPKVGKIGIGLIAANELCNVMEIISTTKGSTELLYVEVNFEEMRQAPEKRERDGEAYKKGDYTGRVEEAPPDAHYTRVLLNEIRGEARDIFIKARFTEPRDNGESSEETAEDRTAGTLSVYGAKPASARDILEPVRDWGDLDVYSQTMLRVGLNVPVQYLPDWYTGDPNGVVKRLTREVKKLDFRVAYDGSDLRKPVVLPAQSKDHLLREVDISGEHVGATGYLYARHGVLRPEWLNGVLIRIRHAAVGDYDRSWLGYKTAEGTLFQRWMSCELWADDRLEEALNIERRTLRITHPAYVELQRAFHTELHAFLGEVRRVLYQEPSTERRRGQAREEVARLREAIELPSSRVPKATREALAEREGSLRSASKREIGEILRSYSVSQLYGLALDVARETLPPAEYRKFAAALARRLLG